ncbi:MAG TPA: GNAT family N-acetyltransferase [Gemmatimonadales bacterium]|nr:GNAT family N-acetyltransferase [Gemmatimonadales bacterium]
MTTVKTTHLELRSIGALTPSRRVPPDVILIRAAKPSPELSRFLYTAVGGDYHWNDRLSWTWSRWMEWLSRPEVETWVAYQSGTPAGYFELEAQDDGNVEIVYFGLLPEFIGQGLGGYLLTQAVHRAFAMRPGVRRVWVHTCTLDHPAALAGYAARGFVIFKEQEADVSLPHDVAGPWPGAERPR